MTVTVSNEDPVLTATLSDATIDEGDEAFVFGGIADPGSQDQFTVVIDWGDGTPTETVKSVGSPAGVSSFAFSASHEFVDDPAGTSDDYEIEITVTDVADTASSATDSASVTVSNVAPTVDAGDDITAESGAIATVNASFEDAGTQDSHTATIDWGGAGTVVDEVSVDESGGSGTVSGSYRYDGDGFYTVKVTVTDDDLDSGTGETSVIVGAAVDLLLAPAKLDLGIGLDDLPTSGELTLQVEANGTPVDDIHAVIDIGPGVEIGSIDENPSSRSGVSVDCTVSGSTITCDATGNNIPTTGVFDIAEITLQAVAIGPVDVKFVEPKTVTTAKSSGNPVLQKAVDAMVRVNGLVAVNMTVDLQKPAPGDIEGFEVRFYGEDALKPTSMNKPWRIFDSQPLFAADLVAGSDSTGGTSFTFMPAGDRTFMAKLDADQEVHDVTGVDAMGTGIFVLNPDQTELSYHITVDTTLLSTQSISAAHFHNAAVGVDGDVVRTLSFDGGTSSGVWKSTDSQSFDSDMVDALLAGELYINVHTSTNSAGEIRGQVLALASGFSAMLDSDQAVPTPSGNPQAMGVGALTLNSAETELEYHITIDTGSLTSDLRFAHFHNARAGATGGVVRTLTFVGGTASGTWRSTDDQPLSPALVKELLGGNIYANVHTDDNLPGEIRGQVLAVRTPIRTGVYHVVVVTNRDGDGLKNTLASLAPGVIIEETDLTIDMSILREGNAVDDPSSERSAIINALDASVLAAAISEDEFDARVDFDRDGDVDDDDLELLKDNYLLYSPVIVEQQ